MTSLYDELARRLAASPGGSRGGGPRFDISVLLFNSREALLDLWSAAEQFIADGEEDSEIALRGAVEVLRPLYGDRSQRP